MLVSALLPQARGNCLKVSLPRAQPRSHREGRTHDHCLHEPAPNHLTTLTTTFKFLLVIFQTIY